MAAIGAIFGVIWRLLDGLRRVLHLLLLLIIFGFVIGALSGSIPVVPARAALVVAPEGELVEQLSGDPIQRAIEEAQGQGRAETLLWDLTDAIRAAAKDDRIPVLVLDLERFAGAGLPTLEELARAVRDFRASGKKVVAYGSQFLQEQYYVAAQADEIYLDPMGFVLIAGYERYRMFFKDAIDKLAVDVNVFRVGQYKSAVEVFTRNDMSPQEREESLVYLSSVWSTYETEAARARKLPADAISKYVAALPQAVAAAGGDAAGVALEAKLITGVKSRHEVESRLIHLVGENESSGSFNSVTASDYVHAVHAEETLKPDGTPSIGVVVASGEILDGDQPPGTIGGFSTARLIREARIDDDVKALVLRVDSPGGSVLASEEIYRELNALKAAGKPLVVSMGDLAASGGYYVAAPADEIWASPATLTGSIGIFAIIPTIDRTLDKVGVHVDGVGTTALSGQLRVDRPLGEGARSLLQSTISRGYEEFLERVAAGRKKSRDQVDQVAQGRVWSGVDAKRLGLVDRLGSFDDAVKAAARRAELTEYDTRFIEPELSVAQQLALEFQTGAVRLALRFESARNPLARAVARLDPLQREVERLSRFATPNRLYAYCFCSAR
jgi:protease-4